MKINGVPFPVERGSVGVTWQPGVVRSRTVDNTLLVVVMGQDRQRITGRTVPMPYSHAQRWVRSCHQRIVAVTMYEGHLITNAGDQLVTATLDGLVASVIYQAYMVCWLERADDVAGFYYRVRFEMDEVE